MNNCCGRVLVVDDEPNATKVLSAVLSGEGYSVLESHDVDRAIKMMFNADVDAVITDVRMPGRDGMQFFDYLTENHADVPVIFLTAYGTVDSAVNSLQRGAFHYFIKPPDYQELKSALTKAVQQRQLKRELESQKKGPAVKNGEFHSISKTPEMLRILETIEAVKDSESSVLINGETGTGKELIARSLHFGSRRRDKPFVAFNCSAIPRELVESELFGYEKGAFTGAYRQKPGKFELAGGGTIFLDEIGEISPALQAKLLQVLQDREFSRLGGKKDIQVDVRVLVATNRNIEQAVKTGLFREDLYYRLNVVSITVPPLRERREEIPIFVEYFLNKFSKKYNKRVAALSDRMMKVLLQYPWFGNVREMENVIQRYVVLRSEEAIIEELAAPAELDPLPEKKEVADPKGWPSLKEVHREAVMKAEADVIRKALESTNWNRKKAAVLLNISYKALLYKMKACNLK